MSSTKASERRPLDQYFTPSPVIRAILPHVEPYLLAGLTLEPACGDGAIVAEVLHAGGKVLAVDVDAACVAAVQQRLPLARVVHRNFLAFAPELRGRGIVPTLVLANPPYCDALRFVEAALRVVSPIGAVAMLLRLGFLETRDRAPFINRCKPDVYVLAERPSFTGNNKTDGTGYAWMVWPRIRREGEPGRVHLLSWDGALGGIP